MSKDLTYLLEFHKFDHSSHYPRPLPHKGAESTRGTSVCVSVSLSSLLPSLNIFLIFLLGSSSPPHSKYFPTPSFFFLVPLYTSSPPLEKIFSFFEYFLPSPPPNIPHPFLLHYYYPPRAKYFSSPNIFLLFLLFGSSFTMSSYYQLFRYLFLKRVSQSLMLSHDAKSTQTLGETGKTSRERGDRRQTCKKRT